MVNMSWNLPEKIVLVTGGTHGIGLATARGLSKLGATVIIAGRDATRGAAAATSIQEQTGNTKIIFVQADLSSMSEVHRLAEYVTAHYSQLHVLVNNVGGTRTPRQTTVDGLEATFATNHLSSFLLTNLLLPLLKTSAPARIINVNSVQHRSGHIDFDDLQSEHTYESMPVYQNAKLANLLFVYELARRLKDTNVNINAADPLGTLEGAKATADSLPLSAKLALPIFALFPQLFSAERAAQSSIYLASSPDVAGLNGKYVNFRKKVVRSSPASYDEVVAQKLWDVSAALTSLKAKITSGEA